MAQPYCEAPGLTSAYASLKGNRRLAIALSLSGENRYIGGAPRRRSFCLGRSRRMAKTLQKRAAEAKAPKVGFVSLGCAKALVNSERILTRLRGEGYVIAPSYEGADLVVVNTCGFLDSAKAESLDAIGEAMAENGRVDRDGLLRRRGQAHPRRLPRCARHYRPAPIRRRHGRDPRRRPAAARAVPRACAARGPSPHAAALRLSENLRRLQQPLHVLHHSAACAAISPAAARPMCSRRRRRWSKAA